MQPQQVQSLEPDLFTLAGQGAEITYATTSFQGKPQLTYKHAGQDLKFTGDEIRTADSELGKLVTVSIIKTVDTGYTSLTLLVPSVALGGKPQQVSTYAIVCKHIGGIQPGHLGARQEYTCLHLHGTASFVAF